MGSNSLHVASNNLVSNNVHVANNNFAAFQFNPSYVQQQQMVGFYSLKCFKFTMCCKFFINLLKYIYNTQKFNKVF